jgi:hypothetical protein
MEITFSTSSILVRDGWLYATIPPDFDPARLHNKAGEVTVRIGGRRRTTGYRSQNHHLNSHLQQICNETGDDFAATKWDCKMRAVKRGYPTITTKDGHVIPWSETDTDTVQCGMLIDTAHEIAAFLGVRLRETDIGE